jgi:hypothetical protein
MSGVTGTSGDYTAGVFGENTDKTAAAGPGVHGEKQRRGGYWVKAKPGMAS